MSAMGEPFAPEATAGAGDSEIEVHLVPLRRRHLRAVLKIESQVYPRPWTLTLFLSELNLRSSRYYVAARVDGLLAGYAGLMFAGEEAHVTNIAVDPARHRQGIGTRLMVNLVRAAVAHGARHLTLEVRMSNAAAQAMYRRFRFETEGVRKNYYAESNEDALIMWSRDVNSPAYSELLEEIEAGLVGSTVDETGTAAGAAAGA
jgi:ribosomal-protein-alanine N-acetyltransferase